MPGDHGILTLRVGTELTEQDALIERAATEVDQSLLEWFRSLSMVERLRACTAQATALERLARVAARNR
jgi:hypothetical protein